MAVTDTLYEVKASMKEISRKRKFKKANADRREAAELQAALAKCRGKLEGSRIDVNRIIRTQVKSIREGQRIGADTFVQEQTLWDASIAYMLLKDAIYALSSINSYDSVEHAYEMLDAAIRQMSGKRAKFRIKPVGERDSYGHVTSDAALRKKEEILNGIFENLKETGNIEECLAAARAPGDIQASRRKAYTDDIGGYSDETSRESDADYYMSRIENASASGDEDFFSEDSDSIAGIRPPEDI